MSMICMERKRLVYKQVYNIECLKQILEASLPAKRYRHSVNVYETALDLCRAHGLPQEKTGVAALLHDCGREVSSKESPARTRELGIEADAIELAQPILLHAKLGVYNARHKYGIDDEEIFEGILYHTTGAAGMSKLAKVVYLADMIEPGRDFPGIEFLRKLCRKDLDEAMLVAYSNTIKYLLEEGLLIHPHCIEGYNELIASGAKKRKK